MPPFTRSQAAKKGGKRSGADINGPTKKKRKKNPPNEELSTEMVQSGAAGGAAGLFMPLGQGNANLTRTTRGTAGHNQRVDENPSQILAAEMDVENENPNVTQSTANESPDVLKSNPNEGRSGMPPFRPPPMESAPSGSTQSTATPNPNPSPPTVASGSNESTVENVNTNNPSPPIVASGSTQAQSTENPFPEYPKYDDVVNLLHDDYKFLSTEGWMTNAELWNATWLHKRPPSKSTEKPKGTLTLPDDFVCGGLPKGKLTCTPMPQGRPQFEQQPLFRGPKKDRTVPDFDDDDSDDDVPASGNQGEGDGVQPQPDDDGPASGNQGEGGGVQPQPTWAKLWKDFYKDKKKCAKCSVWNKETLEKCASCEEPFPPPSEVATSSSSGGTSDSAPVPAETSGSNLDSEASEPPQAADSFIGPGGFVFRTTQADAPAPAEMKADDKKRCRKCFAENDKNEPFCTNMYCNAPFQASAPVPAETSGSNLETTGPPQVAGSSIGPDGFIFAAAAADTSGSNLDSEASAGADAQAPAEGGTNDGAGTEGSEASASGQSMDIE